MTMDITAPARGRPLMRWPRWFRRAWRGRNRCYDPALCALAATFAFTLYFLAFPSLDLAASGWFYSPDGFALGDDPLLRLLRKSSTWVLAAVLATIVVVLIQAVRCNGLTGLTRARRAWVMLFGLILGPGLLVNAFLKAYWGRPRPVHLDLFGGDAPYTPVWLVTDWCDRNCSFTSGEGASAAWIAAAAALAPEPWRSRLLVPALLYAAALSINRIAAGGHFLSDVILSWTLVAAVMAMLHAALSPRPIRRYGAASARPARPRHGAQAA